MQSFEDFQKLANVDHDLMRFRIEQMLEARRRGDMKELSRFFAPSATFELVGPRRTSHLFGRAEGIEAITNFVWALCIEYQWVERTTESITFMGDQAIVRRASLCRSTGTGAMVNLRACSLIKFQDGLIEEFVDWPDNLSLMELLSD